MVEIPDDVVLKMQVCVTSFGCCNKQIGEIVQIKAQLAGRRKRPYPETPGERHVVACRAAPPAAPFVGCRIATWAVPLSGFAAFRPSAERMR
jgi:hypothetical protein